MSDHRASSTSSAAKLEHSRVPGQTRGGRGNVCGALSQSLPSYQHMTGDQKVGSLRLPPSLDQQHVSGYPVAERTLQKAHVFSGSASTRERYRQDPASCFPCVTTTQISSSAATSLGPIFELLKTTGILPSAKSWLRYSLPSILLALGLLHEKLAVYVEAGPGARSVGHWLMGMGQLRSCRHRGFPQLP